MTSGRDTVMVEADRTPPQERLCEGGCGRITRPEASGVRQSLWCRSSSLLVGGRLPDLCGTHRHPGSHGNASQRPGVVTGGGSLVAAVAVTDGARATDRMSAAINRPMVDIFGQVGG